MHDRRTSSQRGVGLIDMLAALALLALASASALPALGRTRLRARSRSAAGDLRLLVHRVRMAAVLEGVIHGARLTADASGRPLVQLYRDGNANGITAADRAAGIDRPLGPSRPLLSTGQWRYARPAVPDAPEDGVVAKGAMLSFAPGGTFSNGTLYLGDGREYVRLRLYGTGGRARVERFDARSARWTEMTP